MTLENSVRLLAGTMILISVILTVAFSPWWLALTTFVGLNLVQSSITGFCPAEEVLRRART
jgi:hypothetical protein